jgi:parallel beta-helix repeat protein
VVAVVLSAVSVVGAAAAEALPLKTVVCGEMISESVRIANDLGGCNKGIVFGANGITIDLDGHTIAGNGAGDGVQAWADAITLMNGTLSNFGRGVTVAGSSVLVKDVVVTGNSTSGISAGVDNSTFLNNVASDNSGPGFVGLGVTYTRLEGNTFSDNQGYGLHLHEDSDENSVLRNKVSGNGSHGIRIENGNATVTKNTVVDNDEAGISVTGLGASGTILKRNVVRRNASSGISVNGSSTTVVLNTASGNDGHGIVVEGAFTAPSAVKRNLVTKNGGDGIRVGSFNSKVSRNESYKNGFIGGVADDVGYGIVALGDTTGRENVAKGNDGPQCAPSSLCK